MGAYFYIHNFFGGGAQAFSTEYTIFVGALIATAIAGLVASFAPKTTAVTGSIYSAGMGYALTFMSMIYAMQWKGIIVEAVTLTLLTVAVLAVIYSKGRSCGKQNENCSYHLPLGFYHRRRALSCFLHGSHLIQLSTLQSLQ